MILNEQVIINNVEVSKCPYLQKRDGEYKCELFYQENCYCYIRDNCYYKQLKIKEQENEELKIYIESNEQQVKGAEKLVMDNDRLLNILQKIKEVALKACECCGECQTEFSIKEYCDFYEILKKIEEAENIQKARKND